MPKIRGVLRTCLEPRRRYGKQIDVANWPSRTTRDDESLASIRLALGKGGLPES